MLRLRRLGGTGLITLLLACGAADGSRTTVQGVHLEPGYWEFTTTSLIEGMQAPKRRTTEKCIKENRTDPLEHLAREQNCEVHERSDDGNTVRWTMTCPTTAHSWNAEGEITSRGITAVGHLAMSMKTPVKTFQMRLDWEAKRVRDC